MWENNQHHTSIVDYPLVYRQDSLPCGIHLRAFKDFKQKEEEENPSNVLQFKTAICPLMLRRSKLQWQRGGTFGLGLKFSKCEPSAAAALR